MSDQTNPIAGGNNPDGNLSASELIAGLTQEQETPASQEEIQNEEQEEIESEEEESEEIESELQEEEEIEQEQEEEEQEIDLESLTPEQIQQLAKKSKSRLLSRFGELTGQVKDLKARLESQEQAKPLPKPIADNPYSELKTREDVEAKMEELERVAEATDRILDDNEDYGSDDVIHTEGGKEFKKKDIRAANRNARIALSKFLPAQLGQIQKSEQNEQERLQWNAAIPEQIPEYADAESELSKQLLLIKERPQFQELLATSEGSRIEWILAHALRSIQQTTSKKKQVTVPVKAASKRVGSNPVGTGARPIQKVKSSDLSDRFEKTGNSDDLVKLLSQ